MNLAEATSPILRYGQMKIAGRLLVAASLSEAVRLSGWGAPLSLHEQSPAPPHAIAALVREIEREPEFVPGVRRVTVYERGSADGSPPAPGSAEDVVRRACT